MPGKYSQASIRSGYVLHPVQKSWMTEKGRPLEYPHTHMGEHKDWVFPIKLDVWMLFI